MHDTIPYKCPVSSESLKYISQNHSEYSAILKRLSLDIGNVSQSFTGLLVNPEMSVIYPVVREIPQLIGNLALIGNPSWDEKNEDLAKRIQSEVDIYSHLAQLRAKAIEEETIKLWQTKKNIGHFPLPADIWIDSFTAADSQFKAYSYLSPLKDIDFLQFGGSGTHAIKALMAGVRSAFLLSPIQGELDLGMALAKSIGVESRFIAIRAIGESIPLADACVDRIYGGGCLHHTDISSSLNEISRVMKSGGRAAFVEPRSNFIHKFIMKLTGGTRLLEAEGSEAESPIQVKRIHDYTSYFKSLSIYESGGILRYFIVLLNRLLSIELPVNLAMKILHIEKRIIDTIGLQGTYGTMAILIEK